MRVLLVVYYAVYNRACQQNEIWLTRVEMRINKYIPCMIVTVDSGGCNFLSEGDYFADRVWSVFVPRALRSQSHVRRVEDKFI